MPLLRTPWRTVCGKGPERRLFLGHAPLVTLLVIHCPSAWPQKDMFGARSAHSVTQSLRQHGGSLLDWVT